MAAWTFLDFVDRNENVIHTWLLTLPAGAKAKIQNRIIVLQAMDVHPPSYVKPLKGKECKAP